MAAVTGLTLAGAWMVHIDGRRSHLVQPSPLTTVINCLVFVSVPQRPGIF